MRNLCAAGLLAAMLGPGAATAWCRQVQITFTAQVVTTTGTPFGLSNIRGKTMTGYFYYDTSTKDSKDTDPLRGLYDHNLSFSGFAASLDGTNFAGSKTPQVQIENIQNIDTMRFIDGFDPTKPNRIITANGVPLPTAAISLSISSDKNPLNGDLLPDPFPFKPTDTHTFSMNDKNGTMLMQFASLTDGSPAPASTIPVKISVTDARARFLVDGGAYTATKTFNWPPLSSHIIEFPVNDDGRQYNASQTSRWGFGGWNDVDGNLPSTGERAITVLATPGLQIVGTVGGFQHRFQMNFFGDAVDLQSFSATLASPPTCGSPGGDSPPTLRSGLVYMDGACYWQSFTTWVVEGPHSFIAYPYPGFAFLGWRGGGTGLTSQTRTVSITNPTVFETAFTPARRVRFLTDPLGMQVTVDDVDVIPVPDNCPPLPVGAPATVKPLCVGEFDFAPGSTHIIGAKSRQHDQVGKNYVFNGFSNGMQNGSAYTVGAVTFNDNYDTVIATFVPGVNSIIASRPFGVPIAVNGKDAATSEYNVFKPGETVQLSAPLTATVGGRKYTFKSWSNGGAREQTATIPKDVDYFNLYADYSVESQILIDSATPNASVLVDGQRCALPCPIDGAPGREVRIEPAPSASVSPLQKMDFVKWTDDGTPVRIETLAGQDSRRLTAVFTNYYLLQLSTNPDNGATFETTPPSADHFFPEGANVTVTAKAKGGFLFNHWTGDVASAKTSVDVKLDRSKTALALLDRVPYLDPNPVRSAATNLPGPVAPGSAVFIVGESLAFEFVQGPDNPLSQSIYGTSAAVDYYRFLPLKFVSPQQVSAVLPADLTPGEHTISVRRSGYDDVIGKFTVAPVVPGLFQTSEKDNPIVLGYRENGEQISTDNPAHPGERVLVLGTGFGPYQLPPIDGTPLPDAPPYPLIAPVQILLSGEQLKAADAFGQPGQTGVTGIRFQVPTGTATGSIELKARIQDQESPAVVVPVGNPEADAQAAAQAAAQATAPAATTDTTPKPTPATE